MKPYSSPSVDIVHFDAQDIVTSSLSSVSCICNIQFVPDPQNPGVLTAECTNHDACPAASHKHGITIISP